MAPLPILLSSVFASALDETSTIAVNFWILLKNSHMNHTVLRHLTNGAALLIRVSNQTLVVWVAVKVISVSTAQYL